MQPMRGLSFDDYSGDARKGRVFRNEYEGKTPTANDTYYVDDLGFSDTGGGSAPQRPRDAAQDFVATFGMGARGVEELEREFHADRIKRQDERLALKDKWATGKAQRDLTAGMALQSADNVRSLAQMVASI